MSAFIVSQDHIAFLLTAAERVHVGTPQEWAGPLAWVWGIDRESGTYERRTLSEATPQTLGQMLWDENWKSVAYRYPEHRLDRLVYEHPTRWLGRIDPVDVLKACHGYTYQSCEHPGWEESEAHAFIEALKDRAIGCLPGYEESSAWAIDSLGQLLTDDANRYPEVR